MAAPVGSIEQLRLRSIALSAEALETQGVITVSLDDTAIPKARFALTTYTLMPNLFDLPYAARDMLLLHARAT